jgi:Tfp pilus assembly protein PilO
LNTARLRLEIALARDGAAVAGVVLLLVAAVAGSWLLFRQQAAESELAARIDAAQQRVRDRPAQPAPPSTDQERLALFEQTLGARGELDAHLRKLFESARRNGLRLELGEYRLSAVAHGQFQRYEVVLPIEGRFGAIQSFSQQVLLALPFAALEDVTVRRESVNETRVEATLRFALYLQGAAPASPPPPATQAGLQ